MSEGLKEVRERAMQIIREKCAGRGNSRGAEAGVCLACLKTLEWLELRGPGGGWQEMVSL